MKQLARLSLALLIICGLSGGVAAQEKAPGKADMADMANMAERCQAMMVRQQQMQQEMAATTARLTTLQEQMNAAKGEKKTEAMADILNTMVDHHRQMQQRMANMMPEMMEHMSEHMAAGTMGECMAMKKNKMKSGERGGHQH